MSAWPLHGNRLSQQCFPELFNRCCRQQSLWSKWLGNAKLNQVKQSLRHVFKRFKVFLFARAMACVSFCKKVEGIIFLRLIFLTPLCFKGHLSELKLLKMGVWDPSPFLSFIIRQMIPPTAFLHF